MAQQAEENWKVFHTLTRLTVAIRVAGIARWAGILVSVHTLVVVCHLRGIVVFVALYATERAVIARCRMAIGALIPGLMVCAAINREELTIVVERRRRPGILAVTNGAIRRVSR